MSKEKIQKNPDFANLSRKQIDGYILLGHASKLSSEEAETCCIITNYIPHHSVLNINKPGKACVVFDTLAKFRNKSLNDNILSGVDLLSSLISVLLKFRKRRYAVVVDVEKMLYQIRVNNKHINALLFYGELIHNAT